MLATEIQQLTIQPGDVLVVYVDDRLWKDQMDTIHALIQTRTGHQRILVLDNAARLGVLRTAKPNTEAT